ncbi:rab11 family-interacting protein 1 isoform X1 [Ascaphus truei]|uniref:rab11 family-interacting protein 1 isoform X1 n=1 Tax=Ascaphus truei TaxID=8439 RepID=UPI003F5A091F
MSLATQSQTWFPTHVQVTVLHARSLRAKGKAGTNDAYAIIQLGKEKYSTSVAEKSLGPMWKEEATFEVPLLHNDNQERCTVRVTVMHRALVGMDKFLGQVDLNLWELHQNKSRKKTQWYPLKSKPGKKAKERGQIEVEIQFMRNNMTASMFDLSMKDKSRSPFGKLKDKLKGKRHDGFPDTASAIVPSMNQNPDDSDEEVPEVDKKKSKLKTLFSKPGLKKNSISQSMSVLPTFQPSSSASKTVLKPSDFSSDFNQAPASPISERRFPHLPVIMTHKRTASADPKQLNQVTSGNNKKEGLSFFSGMRSKNDPITRSNLCINGNHVYMEENEPKSETPKDNSLTNSPQIIRKTPLYASAENLSSKPSNEPVQTTTPFPERSLASSTTKDSNKSLTLPSYKTSSVEESRSRSPPLASEVQKEPKENKKQENKMSSLLSLVTGKKEAPKTVEVENFTEVSKKEDAKAAAGTMKVEKTVDVQSKKTSLNPFKVNVAEEEKPEPPPSSERGVKTSAVKPRLDVSSEAETRLSSSLSNPSFLSAPLTGGQDDTFITATRLGKELGTHNQTTLHASSTSNTILSSFYEKGTLSPSDSPQILEAEARSEESATQSSLYEKPSVPLFWRAGVSPNKSPDPKEVQIVPPFSEKNTVKTSVKSLLDQLKGKPPNTCVNTAVDAGNQPVLKETSSTYNYPEPDIDGFGKSHTSAIFTPYADKNEKTIKSTLSSDIQDKFNISIPHDVNEPPKPTPRVQSLPRKEELVEELKPPKPAPRSTTKLNKNSAESVLDGTVSLEPAQLLDISTSLTDIPPKAKKMEQTSRVGSSLISSQVQSVQTITGTKMAAQLIEDSSYRLDELPVILENPEGTSDDEQLENKDYKFSVKNNPVADVKISSNMPLVKETNQYLKVQTSSVSKTPKDKVDLVMEKKHGKNIDLESKVYTDSSNKPSHDIPDSLKEKAFRGTEIVEEENKSTDSTQKQIPENLSTSNILPSSSPLLPSVSLPTDTPNTSRAESPTTPTNDGSGKVENSGKKKLLRAWVSPSETHPIPTLQSGGTVSSRQRTHPVKPMNTTPNKTPSNISQPIKSHENALNTINAKKYENSDPASAYAELTHDELIQLVLKQKDMMTKKEMQVRELEDYIDNLLVRVIEETPNILRNSKNLSKKAGRV